MTHPLKTPLIEGAWSREGLEDLLARVEGAEGADRLLLLTLFGALITAPYGSGPGWLDRFSRYVDAEAWTEASLALVERVLPGCWYVLGKGRLRAAEPLYGAKLLFSHDGSLGEGEHEHSPALAVCAALLRALIAQAETPLPTRIDEEN